MAPRALQHVPHRMTVLGATVNGKRRGWSEAGVAIRGFLIWVALPSKPSSPIHIGSVSEDLAPTTLLSAEELTKS